MIISKGIPSKERFYLPAVYSEEIKRKGLKEEIRWNIEDIIDHVFPKKYNPKYYEISIILIKKILKEGELGGESLSNFIKENKISKATVYNKIIPKLVAFGLIKRERLNKEMILKPSKSFGNYLIKIGKEWNTIVETYRLRRDQIRE